MSIEKQEVQKTVKDIVKIRCDVCGKEIGEEGFWKDKKDYYNMVNNNNSNINKWEISYVKYKFPLNHAPYEKEEYIHICNDRKCLLKALESVPFDADVHLKGKFIEKLIKNN